MPNTEIQKNVTQTPVNSPVDVKSTFVDSRDLANLPEAAAFVVGVPEARAVIIEPSLLDSAHVVAGMLEATECVSSGTTDSMNLDVVADQTETSETSTTTAAPFAFQITGNPVSICMSYMFDVLKNNILANNLMNKQSAAALTSSNNIALSSRDATYEQANLQRKSEHTEATLQFTNMGMGIATTAAPAISNNFGSRKTADELKTGENAAPTKTWSEFGARQNERFSNQFRGTGLDSRNGLMRQGEAQSSATQSHLDIAHKMDATTPPPKLTKNNYPSLSEGSGGTGIGKVDTAGEISAEPKSYSDDQLSLIKTGKIAPGERAGNNSATGKSWTEEERIEDAYSNMSFEDRLSTKAVMQKNLGTSNNQMNTYQTQISSAETFWRSMHDIGTSAAGGTCKWIEAQFNSDATKAGAEAKLLDSMGHNQGSLADTQKSLAGKYFDEGVAALQQIASARQAYAIH